MDDWVPGHPDPEIRRGPGLKKKKFFFGPIGPQFRLKVRRGGGGGEKPGTPGPSPESATALLLSRGNFVTTNMSVQCDMT